MIDQLIAIQHDIRSPPFRGVSLRAFAAEKPTSHASELQISYETLSMAALDSLCEMEGKVAYRVGSICGLKRGFIGLGLGIDRPSNLLNAVVETISLRGIHLLDSLMRNYNDAGSKLCLPQIRPSFS